MMGKGRKIVCIFVSGFLSRLDCFSVTPQRWQHPRTKPGAYISIPRVCRIVCGNGVIAYNVNYKQCHATLSPINVSNTQLDLVILVPTDYSVGAADRRRVIRKTWANKTYILPLKVQHVFIFGKFIFVAFHSKYRMSLYLVSSYGLDFDTITCTTVYQ